MGEGVGEGVERGWRCVCVEDRTRFDNTKTV